MTVKTLIVDGQVLQTRAWSRGMGRYLLALLGGITEQEAPPRVIVVFNSRLDMEDDRLEVIKTVCPIAEFHTLDLAPGLSEMTERQNSKILDHFVHKLSLQGSVFLQTSLFSFDFQPAYPKDTINTCIFYDMIPLKHWDMFCTYFPEHEYFSRFKFVFSADKVFAISQAVKNDLIHHLGFEAEDIINISGANIPNFFDEGQSLKTTRTRKQKYILLPGGDSPHKNMLRAIRGFDLFNAQFGDTYKLVITSFYSKENRNKMKDLSPNIELSGEISDQELHELYLHAELVLFPSLDEGLGLPVLEAVDYDKKVACSSIGIFRELSKDAFYYFNPYDPSDIAEALFSAIVDDDVEARARKYGVIKEKFTWKKSAHALISAQLKKSGLPHKSKRHSIIVEQDYTESLRRELSIIVRKLYRTHDIDLFIDIVADQKKAIDVGSPLVLSSFLHTRDIADAPRKAGKDRTIVYTKKSHYSLAFERPSDERVYIGTDKQSVISSFESQFRSKEK